MHIALKLAVLLLVLALLSGCSKGTAAPQGSGAARPKRQFQPRGRDLHYAAEAVARPVLWNWFKSNFAAIKHRVSSSGMSYAPTIQSYVCDQQAKADLDSFFEPKLGELEGSPRVLRETDERIDRCSGRGEIAIGSSLSSTNQKPAASSAAKCHGVHHAAGQDGEAAGDQQSADISAEHGTAMHRDVVPARPIKRANDTNERDGYEDVNRRQPEDGLFGMIAWMNSAATAVIVIRVR